MVLAVVTGGAGFVGGQLCKKLLEKHDVLAYDNLSNGLMENVPIGVKLVKADILQKTKLLEVCKNADYLFHFAGKTSVRLGARDADSLIKNNFIGTHNVLEAARKNDISKLIFASSSTVYGNARVIPTPESYGPCTPISLYGSLKLASEALFSAYANNYGFDCCILRLANVIGGGATKGVIPELICKLRRNKHILKILGDGSQRKSYIHVSDCVNAILHVSFNTKQTEIFNIGTDDAVTVREIIDIIENKMRVMPVHKFSGETAWPGDVKNMLLDIKKLNKSGFRPKLNSRQAVEKTINEILKNPNDF